MATISIKVDAESARAFESAPPEEQRKLQLLLGLRLKELTSGPPKSVKELMDALGAEASARGLTPQMLEKLLNES